jgi:heme exporter protein D
MQEFLAMGGYAAFVWSAFGLTAAVLVVNVVSARRRLRSAEERARLRAARAQHRST